MDNRKRRNRIIAWMICILVPIAIIVPMGYMFFGNLWGGAEKVSGHLEETIEKDIPLATLKVLRNAPRYGDVTIEGTVNNDSDRKHLEKMAADWSDAHCTIHVNVEIETHNNNGD